MDNKDIFWLDDTGIKILYNKWYEFFPNSKYKYYRNINSIIRLLIYSIISLLIYGGNKELILFIIILLIIINLIGKIKFNNININNQIKKEIKCRKSTINNPMSNILITMNNEELNIPACNENINSKKLIEENLNYNVYYNSKDLFKKKTGNIKYVKNPSSIYPNNNKEYLNYLYDLNSNNCKINSKNCIGWYDVKYNK